MPAERLDHLESGTEQEAGADGAGAGPRAARVAVLRAAGACVVVDATGPQRPRILHWGRDLGPLTPEQVAGLGQALARPTANASLDERWWLTLLPVEHDGWQGRPGLAGHRDGAVVHPRLALESFEAEPFQPGAEPRQAGLFEAGPLEGGPGAVMPDTGGRVQVVAADAEAGVRVRTELRLEPEGLLRIRHELTNTGAGPLVLDTLQVLAPVPPDATELLDLTGRWCRERSPQRQPFTIGTRARESRRGRTGHDATLLLVAGTPGFGFRHGEVWAAHVAWSGNHVHLAERPPERAGHAGGALGGGELLQPGEIRLAPGDTYTTPWVAFTWSDQGLDGASARVHRWLRARPAHPASPRPVIINTWEAVYFDHDLERLRALADTAAALGVERFVLDDGWFLHRRDDTAGLGDWRVDPAVWPDGLHPLFDHVRSLGMQVGLWVEPEMTNLDSDLARAHPDWLLAAPGRLPMPARHQHVLDLARPEAAAYLLERLDALVGEYRPDFLKWDHNRDLMTAVHAPTGSAGVHAQTRAAYALLDELRRRHPTLEIESCSSGGARIDLGVLERTDRVWASDTNDPIERQAIQRWTGLLVPPELIGSHVGAPRSHTTGRVADLDFRCLTSLFAHAGIEWDVTGCTPAELELLAAWIALYKELRPLLHTGEVVRADLPDETAWLHGVVAPDRGEALYAYVRLTTAPEVIPGPVRLPGLDPTRTYTVTRRTELDDDPTRTRTRQRHAPGWLEHGPTTLLPGTVLTATGLQMPILNPGSGLLLHLHAT